MALRGARVTLRHFLEGTLQVTYKPRILEVTTVRKLPHPQPAEDEKTIDARIASTLSISAQKPKPQPAHGHG